MRLEGGLLEGGQQGMPREVKAPSIVTIEVRWVVEDLNRFFVLPFKEVVLFGKNESILLENMMFGRGRVLG